MPVFLLKSVLSLFVVLSAVFAMFTMFEVFGRAEKKYDVEKLKKLHRANGIFFLALFFAISYLCLDYLLRTKAELSARASFHSVFAIAVLLLLVVKVSFVRRYRQFYGQVKTIGLVVALTALGMAGTSGGYYLLVTKAGTEPYYSAAPKGKPVTEGRSAPPQQGADTGGAEQEIALKTDKESIVRGRGLYESKCFLCHDPESSMTIVGPGHKDILKNQMLPVSGRPATPENIARQLRNPVGKMPSFAYLSNEEVTDIIAYLNTL